MTAPIKRGAPSRATSLPTSHMGRWIAVGLLLGILSGLLFGEYCKPLEVVGLAYVGLLQMTVLPYLIFSLISKLGRLDPRQARRVGLAAVVVLLLLWLLGISVIVLVAQILPPTPGAAFFSAPAEQLPAVDQDTLSRFIPTNIFRSLSAEYVPAVIVFCLFFGVGLMIVPGKERLLDAFDVGSLAIGQINLFLVRFAPLGLFALTAAAAGTLRVEELSRLQAYLILLAVASLWVALGVLPLLLSGLTPIRCRDFLRAAQEPLLTAIATGKLFVVLPQIMEKCEQLVRETGNSQSVGEESTARLLVPMAYPFPHLGKLLSFVFIPFAAWYVGSSLSLAETVGMAATGTVSSFASPLVTIPYLLDRYQLPQDLMQLFLVPGFITMRIGDMVGVVHLMVFTLLVTALLEQQLRIRWQRLFVSGAILLGCLGGVAVASHWYLASTTLDYHLDERLLALEIASPHEEVIVYTSRDDVPSRLQIDGSTLERIREEQLLRVGYLPDHLPYSFFNSQGQLVGLDIELIHHLASRLQVRLCFVPYAYDTLSQQLAMGEIDVAVGGLIVTPERLLNVGFTETYQTATLAVVVPDHRRDEIDTWDDPQMPADLRLGVVYQDLAAAAQRQLPRIDIVQIDSIRPFLANDLENLDGVIVSAEEGAAWNILYPRHTVVVPRPIVQRPVGMAVRPTDPQWRNFLDRWLDFERLEGSLDRLRNYWVEGGGTEQRSRRWSILQDELHWLP